MTSVDPVTGAPLPPDAIQRILFVASKVHVYNIPPMPSTKGHVAAFWTANNNARQIFTARLRILETALQSPTTPLSETVSTTVLLEDPGSAELFAACPITDASSIEPVIDSARFFALRVVGEGGRKAYLGIGFEERSEAFDFGVSLQEVRKVQGMGSGKVGGRNVSGSRDWRTGARAASRMGTQKENVLVKRDFSLKEGETIRVDLGGKVGKRRDEGVESGGMGVIAGPETNTGGSGFGNMSFLPPPPSAQDVRAEMAKGREEKAKEAENMGFDDGEFGEFQ